MKVAELEGALLDYWVLKAIGRPAAICRREGYSFAETRARWNPLSDWDRVSYVDNWENAGPIIEQARIMLSHWPDGRWRGYIADKCDLDGPTPLIAAMRAFVASKFGDEVEDL